VKIELSMIEKDFASVRYIKEKKEAVKEGQVRYKYHYNGFLSKVRRRKY